MMTIRRAVPADVRTVQEILRAAAAVLHERGISQWPDGSPSLRSDSIARQISRREFWLVTDGRDPVAVIAVSADGDPDFWTQEELAEPAVYLSKAAVVPARQGQGLGEMLFRWVIDRTACEKMATWVRLDAWRTNPGLHAYYRQRGWTHVRTVTKPGRNSGALFARPATPDLQAREAFTVTEAALDTIDPLVLATGRLDTGTAVIVEGPVGPVASAVIDAHFPGYGFDEVPQRWESSGLRMPTALYQVTWGQGTRWIPWYMLWPDPAPAEQAPRHA